MLREYSLSIEIKGITVPALIIKIKNETDISSIYNKIEEKLSSAVFKGSMIIIEDEDSILSEDQKKALEELIKKHNSKILGYKEPKKEKSSQKDILPDIKEKKPLKVVNKTIRSGQSIEYDGDVLIIGDVNPDAYVIASGNIIVMGTLRGIAHAGANGDETASIMALKLMPQQLRIASLYTRSPDEIEEPDKPERAYIEDGKIYIEELT